MPDSVFGLPSRVRARLRQAAQLRDARPGEVIVAEGATAVPLHMVTGGALTVTITSEAGRRSIVAVLSAGDLFGGNSYSAATHPPQPEVKALVRSHLLVLAWTDVEELVHRDWAVARWLIRRLLESQHRAQHHTARLLAHGVPGRLEAVLGELAERHGRRAVPGGIRVALPLTQDMLAGLVGASRETVNRALSTLAVDGRVLRLGRSYVLPSEGTGTVE